MYTGAIPNLGSDQDVLEEEEQAQDEGSRNLQEAAPASVNWFTAGKVMDVKD